MLKFKDLKKGEFYDPNSIEEFKKEMIHESARIPFTFADYVSRGAYYSEYVSSGFVIYYSETSVRVCFYTTEEDEKKGTAKLSKLKPLTRNITLPAARLFLDNIRKELDI
jgi:hypothetical protein